MEIFRFLVTADVVERMGEWGGAVILPRSSQVQSTSSHKKCMYLPITHSPRHRAGLLLVVVGSLCSHVATAEEPFERGGKWFVTTGAQYLTSESTSFDVDGVEAQLAMENAFTGGVGVGFDLSDHFTVGLDVGAGSATLNATARGASLSESATLLAANSYLDWNVLKGRFTPLLTANVGFLNLSGDVGGTSAGETDFSFGFGGGVRWDFSDRWFAKAVYRLNWTEFQGFEEMTMVHGAAVMLGIRF